MRTLSRPWNPPGKNCLSAIPALTCSRTPSGEKLPADRKSIAYTFLYRDPAKTLTAAEVDAAHQRVLKALTDKVKGLSFR